MSGAADEIKARINAVELIGETVKLRRSGRTFSGLCPFHVHTKNTPSFVVWPETGTWKCFGQCNDGGDIFKFVMKKEGWAFREALEYLAGRAGVELKPRTPQDVEREEEYNRLRDLLTLAVTYYRNLLINAPQAQTAREHLQKRGLTAETQELFELGYATPAWDAASKFFAERGYTQKEMLDAGLIIERDDGSIRDRFRNRLMIPIRDGQGRPSGFGARALDPDDQPKF
ncbi:MAG: CHC2 zinc finger domain-containing protein, partial [Chloroflexota bacterium]